MSYLMNKNTPVIQIKDKDGIPSEIEKIINPELLPYGLKKHCDFNSFTEWFKKRCLPSDRREYLSDTTNVFGTNWLKSKNYASLTDQFWLKKRGENWNNINFFKRKYSNDISRIMFEPWGFYGTKISNDSPDLATNGVLKKTWLQNNDNTSRLLKMGSKATHQEPLSEVLVSVLQEKLDFMPYVRYDYEIIGVTLCSVCQNFVTEDTEYIPASELFYLYEKKEKHSTLDHLLTVCSKHHVPDAEDFLKKMIFIDSITGNEDRNLGNFGFIRNVNTGKIVSMAPLFDCGAAYWNTKKIKENKRSKLFSSDEQPVINEIRNKFNIENLLMDDDLIKAVHTYPLISDVKKERIIKEIQSQNKRILYADKEVGLCR